MDKLDIHKLPDEIIQLAITFLQVKDLVTCSLVCKKFKEMSAQDYIWKNCCKVRWENKLYYNLTPARERKFANMWISWKEIYFSQERD